MNINFKANEISIYEGHTATHDYELDSDTSLGVEITKAVFDELTLVVLNLEIRDDLGRSSCKIDEQFDSVKKAKKRANQIGKVFGLPKIVIWTKFTQ